MEKHEHVEKDELIYFQEGIFGFEQYKEFLPISLDEENDATLCLQSVEEDVSFIVMNPFLLCEDYLPVMPQADYKKLGSPKEEDLSYYVICVVRDTTEDSTVNLKCPIVVNSVTRQARQIIIESDQYGFRHPLKEFRKEGGL